MRYDGDNATTMSDKLEDFVTWGLMETMNGIFFFFFKKKRGRGKGMGFNGYH